MLNKDLTSGFCIKPWVHAFIKSNGDFSLCCHSEEEKTLNISDVEIEEYWSNEFLSKIRQQMLAGNLPKECRACADAELRGEMSLRQRSNNHYKIIPKYAEKIIQHQGFPKTQPIDVECELTNLCNLKCTMCSGDQSSSLLAENNILKIHNLNQKEFDIKPGTEEKLKKWLDTKPKTVTFRGGETMIVPEVKRLLEYGISNNLLDDTDVIIITNGTKLTNEWLAILQNIKKLVIMVSVDGIGDLNDYIRYGSQWSQIEKAINTMKSMDHARVMLHCTLQNLNVLGVDQLINWTLDNNIFLSISVLETPNYLSIHNFPKELLLTARTRIAQCRHFKNDFTSTENLLNIVDAEINKSKNEALWQEFISTINLRDKHRKNSILTVIPELKEYWNAKEA